MARERNLPVGKTPCVRMEDEAIDTKWFGIPNGCCFGAQFVRRRLQDRLQPLYQAVRGSRPSYWTQ